MLAASGHQGSEGNDRTLLYFGWLSLFIYLATPAGALVDIQTSYVLKNELHATATQMKYGDSSTRSTRTCCTVACSQPT